jgi:peptide deformylase
MAILKIARMGHPVLHQVAEPVDDPAAPEVSAIVRDMIETLDDAGGIGLAAPQVHIPKRIVIFFIPGARAHPDAEEGDGDEGDAGDGDGDDDEGDADDGGIDLTIMINPEIVPVGGEMDLGWEACLSVPDMMGAVARHGTIRYRWQTLDGETMEREASGFHARAVQHECDHLDGILYPMRMEDLSLFGFADEVNRNKALLARPNLEPEEPPEEEQA